MAKVKEPRIILYSGKGGVGKTTVAAATGLRCAAMGKRTLVMSLDAAHSLSDSFDLPIGLHDKNCGKPVETSHNLWIQELDVQEEIERYWGEIYKYLAALFHTTGLDQVVSEELAILPGMEEVSALLYINEYLAEGRFDVMILDCAPTGESLRFISMPSTLEWYMRKVFKLERNLMHVARPLARMVTDIPLPGEEYFKAVERLFKKLEGVDSALLDGTQTTVRLVTNAEKMVVNETQRAFLYFCLYGMTVDTVIVNRLIPPEACGGFFDKWHATQERNLELIRQAFEPIPLVNVELFDDEVLGLDALQVMSSRLYADEDPTEVRFEGCPYHFSKMDGDYRIRLKVPFTEKRDIEVFRDEEQLIIRVGGFKRHVPLPKSMWGCRPESAHLEGGFLDVRMVSRPLGD